MPGSEPADIPALAEDLRGVLGGMAASSTVEATCFTNWSSSLQVQDLRPEQPAAIDEVAGGAGNGARGTPKTDQDGAQIGMRCSLR
jgi:hypothetical protein